MTKNVAITGSIFINGHDFIMPDSEINISPIDETAIHNVIYINIICRNTEHHLFPMYNWESDPFLI